jgi:hypothetical protein
MKILAYLPCIFQRLCWPGGGASEPWHWHMRLPLDSMQSNLDTRHVHHVPQLALDNHRHAVCILLPTVPPHGSHDSGSVAYGALDPGTNLFCISQLCKVCKESEGFADEFLR